MARGFHRVYLGAAPGVGKTFAMLNEGVRRAARGEDVVVGWFQEHGRPETTAKLEGLEVVPPQRLDYRSIRFEEMDIDALLERKPALALVDELAHTNVPGSRNEKRWQDVEELLEAGISVISTLNIQHLESINDVVERITGVRQAETIPDAVVRRADQIELVDLTPEALRRRLARGDVYSPEKIDAALANYFRPGNLGALRELALLWVADRVEESLDAYMEAHEIADTWETRERVVVAISGRHNDEALVRRAARLAGRMRGELLACHVRQAEGFGSNAGAEALEEVRRLVIDLGGSYHEITGADIAPALIDFARAEHATQLVLGASSRSRLTEFVRGSVINYVNRASGPIDVHIISEARGEAITEDGDPINRRHPAALSQRRRLQVLALVALGLPLLTLLMIPVRAELGVTATSLIYLGLVIGIALVGGWRPAVLAALVAAMALDFIFIEPYGTFKVEESKDILALLVFLGVATAIGMLVGQLGRRTIEAETARREAQALAYVAGGGDELQTMVEAVRVGFSLRSVALLERDGDGWRAAAAAGPDPPATPSAAEVSLAAGEHAALTLSGRALSSDDRRVLGVLARQLGGTIERSRLQAQVEEVGAMEASDSLRIALLRTIAYDLKRPLGEIDAAVDALLDSHAWFSDPESRAEVTRIGTETDRLERLVGGLLEMSRLQAGSFQPRSEPVGVAGVVTRMLEGIAPRADADRIVVEVPASLPSVLADDGLLERALTNVVENALAADPKGRLTIAAGEVGERVSLRVVDSGPGIPAEERDRLFAPFEGVGEPGGEKSPSVGLAVARSFVEAMTGELLLDETPGGGLTVSIVLPVADRAVHPPVERSS